MDSRIRQMRGVSRGLQFAYLGVLLFARIIILGDEISVMPDGSIAACFPNSVTSSVALNIDFGMPRFSPVKRWRDGQALKTQWSTNGVLYTQTVLISAVPPETPPGQESSATPVLLVDTEGENTNSEYTDAFAALAVQIGKQNALLQLTNNVIWVREGTSGFALGTLEIPESGIKTPEGEVLEFHGAMPPSIKGSMTLKLPLRWLENTHARDRLLEMDYEAAHRQAVRPGAAAPGTLKLTFGQPPQTGPK